MQAQVDDDDQDGERHQQKVILLRSTQGIAQNLGCAGELEASDRHRVNQRNALRAVGDIDRRVQVVEEDADNFTETERDDGQIVAAQLERWRTEQDTKNAGDHRANRQNDPERQVQAEMRTGQQRVNVSAHGIEGDVTEIEQAGKADDDVQAKRQEDIQDGEIRDAHPGLTAHRGDKGQGNQGDGNQRDAKD